jgi:threonine/homoserine/homoserine lactone efflux protein
MLTSHQLALYLPAALLIIITPGPDMMLTLSRGLSQGRTAAALHAVGVALGIMVHAVLAALGVAALMKASAFAFWVFKLAGGLYLIYLGLQLWRAQRTTLAETVPKLPARTIFIRGVLSNVLNPKVVLFMLALIPQFVSLESSASPTSQMLALGGIYALMTVIAYASLGAAASRAQAWIQARPSVLRGFNRLTAALFLGAGAAILAMDRR